MAKPPAGWPLATGHMALLFRAHHWQDSSLGLVAGWPPALRTVVDLMLSCDAPMLVLWGADQVQLYNDAYLRVLRPDDASFGQPLPEHPAQQALYRRILGGETVSTDGPLATEDGRADPARLRFSHSPLRDPSGAVAGVLVSVHPAQRAQASNELQHRVRNLLAILRSIVRRSARPRRSLEDYAAHLDDRLAALARTHALLRHDAVALETMVYEELFAQRATESQIAVEGPEVLLSPRVAQVIGLALHELALNAVKFGALDAPDGHLAVRWTIDRARAPWLTLTWRERGVAMPVAPGSEGFGTELLTRQLPYELDGDSLIQFHADGIEAVIRFPVEESGGTRPSRR